ncbi:hypothetical protein [Caballeronia grimmiae]|uniref:Lipoprotein n=1 Tax=Caballeronia grimmiae TaxID=1071679 RepID=A0ABQ1RGQ5_9BURK|nr:hypothetical protein [Caballeronia grimmiae]GGD67458.1 hypothetical protein GCM10010985_22290 [Caballeronia grimmiae]
MPRYVPSLAVTALAALTLSACADSSDHRKHPPQDPPDYHGVPTDTRPPSMQTAPPQPK